MCYFPKLILNKRYLPTKKNNYNPPECTDERMKYVAIGCGKCYECRRQKAHEWQIRLNEELKQHEYNYFITLTFSEEALDDFEKELYTDNPNATCTLAVRRFLERVRYAKRKLPFKHWLINELGHNNTERVHIHGILFSKEPITNEQLTKWWKYGRTDTGQYCSERTINYIVKYVTKIDNDHKGFEAVILCSSGLGRNYVENTFYKDVHTYKPKTTKQTYTLNNGTEVALPIYYRNHFWNEETRLKLWTEQLDKGITYIDGIPIKEINTAQGQKRLFRLLNEKRKENKALGYGDDTKDWDKKMYKTRLKMLNKTKK